MVYAWKIPTYKKVSAQDAGEHIEELCNQHGEVTPEILLEDSRPPGAVLHPCYEWDDYKAAEKYRLYQSKKIISNLVAVTLSNNEPVAPTVAFVSVKDRNEKASYRPVEIALSDEVTKYQVLKNAAAELKMMERKYGNLIDFSKLLEDYIRGKTA